MNKTADIKHPYRVREMTSGRNGAKSYIVVMMRDGKKSDRVSVHAVRTRACAQAEADEHNIGHMVRCFADDPRPYHIRRAEAEAQYRCQQSK